MENWTIKASHRSLIRWLAFPMLILVGSGVITSNVRADGSCQPVHGAINSVFSTQNCTSPVGLCTLGTITGAGPLDGATSFVALAIAPAAGMPAVEASANLSYSGQLTIVTTDGTLVMRDLGVLDAAHLAFTEMERPLSGTGVFASPGNSAFFISRSIVDSGQGFHGALSGVVCTVAD